MNMAQFEIPLSYNVRNKSRRLLNFSFAFGVEAQPSDETLANKSSVSLPLERLASNPSWKKEPYTGFGHLFRKHNGFKDQELHDRIAYGWMDRQGHSVLYYVSSYDPSNDTIWHEDNNRSIERVFEIRLQTDLRPENEIYRALGIDGQDDSSGHIHITMFLQQNYQSLRENGIDPKLDEDVHNPILYQRGHKEFAYHGYTADQIFPKPGDYVKQIAYDKLYRLESYTNADPMTQHRYRKYFWKINMREYTDTGMEISSEVTDNVLNDGFIDDLFGQAGIIDENTTVDDVIAGPQFDVTDEINIEKQKGVLYRPCQVPVDSTDFSKDFRAHPGFERYGGW
jgi:hypothetical protein